mgnify:CR=1 FL=1
MKFVITILVSLLFLTNVHAQCETGTIKMPVTFHVVDTAHGWNYCHADGTILWRNEPSFNLSLIPQGGYVTYGELFKQPYTIKGFLISYVKSNCNMDSVLMRTDVNGKNIDVKGRVIAPNPPLRKL